MLPDWLLKHGIAMLLLFASEQMLVMIIIIVIIDRNKCVKNHQCYVISLFKSPVKQLFTSVSVARGASTHY